MTKMTKSRIIIIAAHDTFGIKRWHITYAAVPISLGQLTNELDFLLSEAPDPCVAQQYRETLLCLQSIIQCKLNQATEELLKVRAMLRYSYEAHFYFNFCVLLSVCKFSF